MYDNSTSPESGGGFDSSGGHVPDGNGEAPGATQDQSQTQATSEGEDQSNQEAKELLENFPPEIATLLIVAGVAGMVLPGPVGTPLLLAGGVVMWPRTFRPIERWFNRKFPKAHREGVIQLKDFLRDLNARFPGKP